MTATTTVPFRSVNRETEKAVLLACDIGYCSSVGRSVEIWFPKSQVVAMGDREAEIKAWIVAQKLAELRVNNITPWFE
jgi:hypothetical protein